jgi:hypothetical protein
MKRIMRSMAIGAAGNFMVVSSIQALGGKQIFLVAKKTIKET